ncbi:MAG: NAD(P)/FAD-dependent oxidoreductase [Pseudomonadota bacterium]
MIDVDYLIVGAGATGLGFADRLLTNSAATMAIIDRRALPGGHWVDGYPFVRLHAPSVLYGVDSATLGHDGLDTAGLNAGLGHCARGAEIIAHYEHCLHERLIPSGRVEYLPAHEMGEDGVVRQCLTGDALAIGARKIVDASYFTNAVPKTTPPPFPVDPEARLIGPHELPALATEHSDFVVIGSGKTGMDAVTFLIGIGARAEQIRWIAPRDPWVYNREGLQAHPSHLKRMVELTAAQLDAMAYAASVDEFEDRMDQGEVWLRVDPAVRPTMFHAACASKRECAALRSVQIIRQGYVRAIDAEAITLDGGKLQTSAQTLVVNCTASALTKKPPVPIFAENRITMQFLRFPAPAFSAAMIAEIETVAPEEEKNSYALPTGVTDVSADFLRTTLHQQLNQMAWNRNPQLRAFYRSTRLDALGRLVRSGDREDPALKPLFERIQEATPRAAENIPKLLAQAAPAA